MQEFKNQTEMRLRETEPVKIYCCGYCYEILTENEVIKHLKKIHNVLECQVGQIITKVVMF